MNANDAKTGKKSNCIQPAKLSPAGLDFVAVVQADYTDQMSVLRWLCQDDSYACIYILHDKDIYTQEDITRHAETASDAPKASAPVLYTRKNGDGSQSQYKAGDVKPAHYHLIVRVRKKMRASTLQRRFSDLVHFETTGQKFGDTFEACRYLTHECFRARDKYQYDRSEILFSGSAFCDARAYYNDLMHQDGAQTISDLRRFIDYADSSIFDGVDDGLNRTQRAVRLAIQNEDLTLVRRIMSHGYFFDKML